MLYSNVFVNPTIAYTSLCGAIMEHGIEYNDTLAIFNVCFTILCPEQIVITEPSRNFSTSYAEREFKWYLSGDRSAEEIARHAPMWRNMMDEQGNVNSNYGWHWQYGHQFDYVTQELMKNQYSRRAVISHFDYIDRRDGNYEKDTPCNLIIHYYLNGGKLNYTVMARSIDLVFGFCNDQYTIYKYSEIIADEIGYEIGEMNYFITNLHVYKRDIEKFKLNEY